ncbi:fungal-specific transcription factor domain-containing protein [Colletotrichum godetiae]|uniref:Fungal-specific transcription factor domain-containing protein n=1 Tax=Colletotrichum godetiae TaxID=1209918 RepID=A0AAJ0ERF9_9PEZI|nr:fungal-specific transcription factor domain-containing protein [Colletotrichum godetiae]KAK1673881.1 fungal-specific transcription factor domain-containing protein [Colletotrichum godetiae]
MAGEGESPSSSAEQEAETANSAPRGKRASNACTRCRERKVKCSGSLPCANCLRKSVECVFDKEDRKVVVSERFLNELKRKSGYGVDGETSTSPIAKRSRRHRSTSPADAGFRDAPLLIEIDHGASPPAHNFNLDDGTTVIGGEDDREERRGFSNMRNPLASGPSKFLTDATGRRRWLGPSSTWAYSRQVLNMIQGHLGQHESPEVPLNVDAEAFKLDWPSSRDVIPQATVDIPSLDYALYLTNTVKFHLGQTYHLFDEESFMTGLYDFYRRGPRLEPTADSRLWYIQFLMIMAFGKALLVPGNPNQTPPGSSLVTRALELLPDVHGLYQEPVLSVEILCSLSLYLQSVDHRNSAYTYIGQAFRIAVSQGLHREPLKSLVNDSEANRLRCVWWTLYILDRKMTSLMGAPNSIQDSDITVQLPRSDPVVHKYKALGIHVVLSQLLAKVLNTVYGMDGKLDPSFLKSVQEVLRDMARLAPQLTAGFEFKFNNSEPASRVSATLNLCYHQCVVLATRPLLMCLVQDVLGRQGNLNRGLASPIKALLKTSSDSANKSLRILSTLQSQHLLESFLPFDLEQAFSSAFVLTLMTSMPGLSERDNKYMQTTTDIFDTMIARGNVVARFRKEELEKLQEILRLAQRQLHAPPSASGDGSNSVQNEVQTSRRINVGDLPSSNTEQLTEAGPATGSTANGLASEQMLSIAGLLDWEPNTAAFDDDQLAGGWLWTEAIAPDFDFSGGLL